MPTVVSNQTSFPHLLFSNTDSQGREFGVLMLKAAFDIASSGRCTPSDEQEPFSFTDSCHGDVNVTSLRIPSDLVSFKPRTDIIVDAVAHSPGGEPSRSWIVEFEVADDRGHSLRKRLRVMGRRFWVPRWKRRLDDDERRRWRDHRDLFEGWTLSTPEPVRSLPIRYEFAFGGSLDRGVDPDGHPILEAFEYNPLGVGLLDPDASDHSVAQPAPQIEDPDDAVTEPYRRYRPAGYGPIPPAWLPRRPLGGTFDRHWMETHWPRWPSDYDFAYNNSAAEGLKADDRLGRSLTVSLRGLRRGNADFQLRFALPDILTVVEDAAGVFRYVRPRLDTLTFKIAADDLFDCRLFAVWRQNFREDTTESIGVFVPEGAEAEYFSREAVQSPHPSDCAVPSRAIEDMR